MRSGINFAEELGVSVTKRLSAERSSTAENNLRFNKDKARLNEDNA
jgi:hypothetical protein